MLFGSSGRSTRDGQLKKMARSSGSEVIIIGWLSITLRIVQASNRRRIAAQGLFGEYKTVPRRGFTQRENLVSLRNAGLSEWHVSHQNLIHDRGDMM